jgi:hypothetical protein
MPVSPEKSLRYIEKLRRIHGLKKRTQANTKQAQISRTNRAINSGLK